MPVGHHYMERSSVDSKRPTIHSQNSQYEKQHSKELDEFIMIENKLNIQGTPSTRGRQISSTKQNTTAVYEKLFKNATSSATKALETSDVTVKKITLDSSSKPGLNSIDKRGKTSAVSNTTSSRNQPINNSNKGPSQKPATISTGNDNVSNAASPGNPLPLSKRPRVVHQDTLLELLAPLTPTKTGEDNDTVRLNEITNPLEAEDANNKESINVGTVNDVYNNEGQSQYGVHGMGGDDAYAENSPFGQECVMIRSEVNQILAKYKINFKGEGIGGEKMEVTHTRNPSNVLKDLDLSRQIEIASARTNGNGNGLLQAESVANYKLEIRRHVNQEMMKVVYNLS